MYQDDLAKLSKDELIALALAQTAQIEKLTRRIADLEAKLGGPPKTPDNSSLPPSQGRKPNRAERRAAKRRNGRPGVFRVLAPNPDRIVARVARLGQPDGISPSRMAEMLEVDKAGPKVRC